MERNRKPRILVVDDHEDNIELLRARLEARGYDVDGAPDGQAALEQVDKVVPDLILLDVMMPKMDGMEVARRLKARMANKELPFIPIIMQTALDTTEHKVEGLGAGAIDYITKPINFAELEARVSSQLHVKKLQSELEARDKEVREVVAGSVEFAKNASDAGVLELIFARQDMAYPVVAPPGVPAERVAVLRKAFDETVKDPDYLADARKQMLETDAVKGAQIAALVDRLYASPPEIIARAKQAMEDGKKITVSK